MKGTITVTNKTEIQAKTKVDKETIQSIYTNYCEHEYLINRRYQRKLVWQTKEKQALIDTILKGYPLPQFLFAEIITETKKQSEIIDGLQRMSAIIGYIENEYPWGGKYFDLDTFADGQARVESGLLTQKEPRLERSECRKFLRYSLGITTYESNDESKIEEIFRRINSTGQKLSTQDLRQAGSVSPIAELVRQISAAWRGDSTQNRIGLEKMKAISINDDTNTLGIDINSIFLVKHKIVSTKAIRSSGDEQLVLDLVCDMLFNSPFINTSTGVRDFLYGRDSEDKPNKPTQERITEELSNHEWTNGTKIELFRSRFLETMARIERIFSSLDEKTDFRKACGVGATSVVPRYFATLYYTVYRFLYIEGRDLTDPNRAGKALIQARLNEHMKSGGEWDANSKAEITDHLYNAIEHCFDGHFSQDSSHTLNPDMSVTEFNNLLTGTRAENHRREFKQGLLRVNSADDIPKINEKLFDKILCTLTAISNSSPTDGGTIIIGIADSKNAAREIERYYDIKAIDNRGFHIVGIDREVTALGYSTVNEYIDQISQKIRNSPKLNSTYRSEIVKLMRLTQCQGHTLIVLFAPTITEPIPFDGKIYHRVGSSTLEVKANQQFHFNMQFADKIQQGEVISNT